MHDKTGRRYKKSPIIEAVCEFRFDPSLTWDITVPGLVYEKVKDDFPKKRAVGMDKAQQQGTNSERVQFLQDDEKVLIQVWPHGLSVNHLQPYPSWNAFQPLIKKGFDAYCKAADPRGIQHVGLRYVNRIEIPKEKIEMEEYFEFYPHTAANVPRQFGSFIVGIEVPHQNSRDVLRLQLTSLKVPTPQMSGLVLDLDYFLAKPGKIQLDEVFEWTKVAHDHLEQTFEACIKDALRELFEEVKE